MAFKELITNFQKENLNIIIKTDFKAIIIYYNNQEAVSLIKSFNNYSRFKHIDI